MPKVACSLCNTIVDARTLVNPNNLEPPLVEMIRRERPEWEGKRGVCKTCREQYRAKKFLGYLEDEYTKISEMEKSLVTQIARRGRVSKLVHQEFEATMTFGERIADRVAQFGGSWTFIMIFGGILIVWMAVNTWVLAHRAFDPYPFILLNLVLSTLAALQAPVIMMSQNRQDKKDRLRGELDYDVNRRAEIEIQSLAAKLNLIVDKIDDVHDHLRMSRTK